MTRKFTARFLVHEKNGTRLFKEVGFTSDEGRDRLYTEERRNGRVTNIISNLTGYSTNMIEFREILEG